MKNDKKFDSLWTPKELAVFKQLDSPAKIQNYLDSLDYHCESVFFSPRSVIRERMAHCADGAFFGAAALRRIGYKPLIVDLTAVHDDDHMLAIYRRHGLVGAVAQSNVVGLRYREPVYRTLRELVMSYFEQYFNFRGERTLRKYSIALDLSRLDHLDWMRNDSVIEGIITKSESLPHFNVVPTAVERELVPVDKRSLEAGMMGADKKGLYKG